MNINKILINAVSFSAIVASSASFALAQNNIAIGTTTALMAEASTAEGTAEYNLDGQSGDIQFPFIGRMKAIATVGESDPSTGRALTGYPDGQAAWLVDDQTVRIAYQSESYATMSSETYPWKMRNGVKFTGSHIHTIDYDRAAMSEFLSNDLPASSMFKSSDHLFDTVYNVFGDEVVPKNQGGLWGNQSLPNGTIVNFNSKYLLTEGEFFFHSFCGAHYEKKEKYGKGIGFADNVWLTAEEWNIQRMFEDTGVNTHDTMGLASVVVDVDNSVAYTAPALGQTGYEKLLPLNPMHKDYVVMVLAGYNHGVEPAPLRIYVGKKGVDANNNNIDQDGTASERDKFLARNGLLYGRIYGFAIRNEDFERLGISNIDTKEKMLDNYLMDASAPASFDGKFFPTSYRWKGWETPVAVIDTEMTKWQLAAEQPKGYTYFVGDSKTEHPAVDPDITKQRYVQNMTNKGALVGLELTDFSNDITNLKNDLPVSISASGIRILAAVDGAISLNTGGKGIKPSNAGTHSVWQDGRAQIVAPDGLQWIKTADADILIVDEDSGNEYGERKIALVLNSDDMSLRTPSSGYFLAMAGGKMNPRAAAGISAIPGTFSKATSSEFSGTWNISALLSRKSDGTFYTKKELAGTREQILNSTTPANKTTLLGVLQHKGESAGIVKDVKADQGGQVFLFNLNLPFGSEN